MGLEVDGNKRTIGTIPLEARNAFQGDGKSDWYWSEGGTVLFPEKSESLTNQDRLVIFVLVWRRGRN